MVIVASISTSVNALRVRRLTGSPPHAVATSRRACALNDSPTRGAAMGQSIGTPGRKAHYSGAVDRQRTLRPAANVQAGSERSGRQRKFRPAATLWPSRSPAPTVFGLRGGLLRLARVGHVRLVL